MRYAKLIDEEIFYAPNPIVDGEWHVFTTDPTPYGYKPVIIPAEPQQEGYVAVPDGWEEVGDEIIQKWRFEPVDTTVEDKAHAYEILIGNEE